MAAYHPEVGAGFVKGTLSLSNLSADIVLSFERSAQIKGVVRNLATGAGVGGVEVALSFNGVAYLDQTLRSRSAANGVFLFDRVIPEYPSDWPEEVRVGGSPFYSLKATEEGDVIAAFPVPFASTTDELKNEIRVAMRAR
jgi:hypothetical protein